MKEEIQALGVNANIVEVTTPTGYFLAERDEFGVITPLDHDMNNHEDLFRAIKLNSEMVE